MIRNLAFTYIASMVQISNRLDHSQHVVIWYHLISILIEMLLFIYVVEICETIRGHDLRSIALRAPSPARAA